MLCTKDYYYPVSIPAKNSELSSPSRTIAFADNAGWENNQYTQQYGLYAPIYLDARGNDKGWGDASPSMHFRHNGNANICWADGHVVTEGPITYTQSGWGCSESTNLVNNLGWFGGEKEDAIELFRVRKTL